MRTRVTAVRVFVVAFLASAAACGEGVSPFLRNEAVVLGNVRTESGAGVGSAKIAALVFATVCGQAADADSRSETLTDVNGDYALTVRSHRTLGRVCVSIEVVPPVGSGLVGATLTDRYVMLTVPGGTARPDTLRLDVVLSPG